MAPNKGGSSSSGVTSIPKDVAVPSLLSYIKRYLKKHDGDFATNILISLTTAISPNALRLGPAFLEST